MGKDIELSTVKKKKSSTSQNKKVDAEIVEVVTSVPKDDLKPVTFSTLDFHNARKILFIPFWLTVAVCILAIIMTFFYFVPLWDPISRLDNLKVRIVIKDTGYSAGPMTVNIAELFAQTITTTELTKNLFEWDFVTGEEAQNYTFDKLYDEVVDEDVWIGLMFPKYYTTTMLGAYTGLIQTPVYINPVEYIHDEAKQYTTALVTDTSFTTIFTTFDLAVRQSLDQLATASPTAPEGVLMSPVYRNVTNAHPVKNMGEYFSSYITLVVLWVCMIVTISLSHVTYREVMTDTFKMHITVAFAARFVTSVASSFFSSLFVTIFLDGLGLHLHHGFGHLFAVLWFASLTFCGMIEFIYSFLNIFGFLVLLIVLVLQLVTSDGIYSYRTMVKGFRWVTPVFPFSHCVKLIRFSAFNACKHQLGLNIGVVFIWMIGSWVLGFIGNYFHIGRKLAYKGFPMSVKGFVHLVEFLG